MQAFVLDQGKKVFRYRAGNGPASIRQTFEETTCDQDLFPSDMISKTEMLPTWAEISGGLLYT